MDADAPLLSMRHVSKTFPGVRALTDVQLDARAGEVLALMGENGAGKSTLMKILAGAYTPDPGAEFTLDGRRVSIDGPLGARDLGIAIIYQELALAPNLSVAENIHLGREPTRRSMVDRAAMRADCGELLKSLGATFGPRDLVSDLSIAERQMVEIGRALHARSRILVMDEPTTALSARETQRLFGLIARLKADGLAIIYISHRMAEVYELADRVTVLRDGAYVGTLIRTEAKPEAIVRMMVGRDLSSFYKKEHAPGQNNRVVLRVDGLTDGGRVRPCSLVLHAGEVLGLAGLVGAGRTELARLIYGADARTGGHVRIDDRAADFRDPARAIDAGLVYLTEDRKAQGLFLDMTVSENVNLGVIERDASGGWLLNLSRARARVAAAIRALGIRVAGPQVEVGSLSGGNQQKVLLSRLLETEPKVILLDEPTRGVDVGAKSEIYRIIDQLARGGAAVLVISSELPEVVGICDRVVVMREGAIAGEVGGDTGTPITEESIMALATGVDLQAAA